MRTVMIVTQRFYPDPVVGAVRLTQWAKWLPKHGWRPIIVCRNYGFSMTREEIAELIHPDAEVIYLNDPPRSDGGRKQPPQGKLLSAAVRVLGPDIVGAHPRNFVLRTVKDAVTKLVATRAQASDLAFWREATGRIADLVRLYRPDAIVTSSPPVAGHDVGLHLKREFPEVRWLADFRDVFRQSARYRVGLLNRWQSHRSLQFETAIYRTADRIICAIPTHERWIRKRFPQAASKTVLLLNGTPEEMLYAARPSSLGEDEIKVIGFSEAQESTFLAQAVSHLREGGKNIRLKFVGRFPSVKPEIDRMLGDGVVFTGPMRHDQALEETVSARMLVAVLSKNRSRLFGISSKLFEYLAVPTPVIVINPTRPDRRLFSRLPGVWMLPCPTAADIEAALQAALQAPADELSARAALFREKWSRRSQVEQLAAILDKNLE